MFQALIAGRNDSPLKNKLVIFVYILTLPSRGETSSCSLLNPTFSLRLLISLVIRDLHYGVICFALSVAQPPLLCISFLCDISLPSKTKAPSLQSVPSPARVSPNWTSIWGNSCLVGAAECCSSDAIFLTWFSKETNSWKCNVWLFVCLPAPSTDLWSHWPLQLTFSIKQKILKLIEFSKSIVLDSWIKHRNPSTVSSQRGLLQAQNG